MAQCSGICVVVQDGKVVDYDGDHGAKPKSNHAMSGGIQGVSQQLMYKKTLLFINAL